MSAAQLTAPLVAHDPAMACPAYVLSSLPSSYSSQLIRFHVVAASSTHANLCSGRSHARVRDADANSMSIQTACFHRALPLASHIVQRWLALHCISQLVAHLCFYFQDPHRFPSIRALCSTSVQNAAGSATAPSPAAYCDARIGPL
jgi:hypothetical protein